MSSVQINEALLADDPFFANGDNLNSASQLFHFASRRVILGKGALSRLGAECLALNAKRVFLVRDPGVAALEAPLRQALENRDIQLVGVYDQIAPNPHRRERQPVCHSGRKKFVRCLYRPGWRQHHRYRQNRSVHCKSRRVHCRLLRL